jgi:hypothetical protein
MNALKQAVAAGFHDRGSMNKNADLAPLAGRSDFQQLAGDLAFPADPFSRPP